MPDSGLRARLAFRAGAEAGHTTSHAGGPVHAILIGGAKAEAANFGGL
jgi:hypothetical protein